MPYFVQSVILPSVTIEPNGTESPQLQQFATQLTTDLNALEQRGFHLDQVIGVPSAAVLIFKE